MKILKQSKVGVVPYIVVVPDTFDPAKKYPTFFALHGLGQMSVNYSDAEFKAKVIDNGNFANLKSFTDTLDFVAFFPQLIQSQNKWVPGWEVDYMIPLVDFLLKEPYVNPNMLYATGLSLGGNGVWAIINSPVLRPKFAAAIPICGPILNTADWKAAATDGIPILAFHAEDDKTVNVSTTKIQVDSFNQQNPATKAQMTIYPTGGHSIWGRVYGDRNTYTWALNKGLPRSTVTETKPDTPTKTILSKHLITVYSDGSIETLKQ